MPSQNTTFKATNYLGSFTEQKANKGHSLPSSLSKQIKHLNDATTEVKRILGKHLPTDILNHFWVVNFTGSNITIAVNSITAANHIQYMASSYVEVLQKQSKQFADLASLKTIVSHI